MSDSAPLRSTRAHIDELDALLERMLALPVSDPDFALPNADETLVDSRALLARGPLVVTFYRGRW